MRISINGLPVTVLNDRVKRNFITTETDGRTATPRAPPEQATQIAPQSITQDPAVTQTTRSSRRVRFPYRYNVRVFFFEGGGGDVGTPHNTRNGPF